MKITCLCMTHGRPYLLEESLECFLRQKPVNGVEYEFLIVNDCPEQELACDAPGVRVVNLREPFTDMSDKQNWSIRDLCGEWVAYWDDDDIWRDFRLALSCSYVLDHPEVCAVKQSRAWYSENNEIKSRPSRSLFFGSAIFQRDYYLANGGATAGQPADQTGWDCLERGGRSLVVNPTPSQTVFLYRWGGPGFHDSAVMRGDKAGMTNLERHRRFRERTLASPRFKAGRIELHPHWTMDYEAAICAAIATGKGELE